MSGFVLKIGCDTGPRWACAGERREEWAGRMEAKPLQKGASRQKEIERRERIFSLFFF
jgi:hypothetical protein